MENSKELKPCPFCGGPAERVNIDPTDEHEPNCGGSYIFCPSCLACSKVVFGEKIGLEEAWNMRTTHDRALEALDAAIRKEYADRAVEKFWRELHAEAENQYDRRVELLGPVETAEDASYRKTLHDGWSSWLLAKRLVINRRDAIEGKP